MKTLLAALAGVSVLAICAPAAAETYASIGYSRIDAGDFTLGAVTARGGWQSESFFGVEGEVSVGVQDDSDNIAPITTLELKHNIAVFGVARFPVSEGFEVLARVGYGSGKVEDTTAGFTTSQSESGIAYGVGAQYNFGANGIRGDLTRQDFDGEDVDSITVSFVRKF